MNRSALALLGLLALPLTAAAQDRPLLANEPPPERLPVSRFSVMPYIGRSGWNTLRTDGAIPDDDLLDAIDWSYDTVVAKLPKKDRPV